MLQIIKELRQANLGLWEKMSALSKKAFDEKRIMTQEEETSWKAMDAEFEARKRDIERHERNEARKLELARLDPRSAGREDSDPIAGDGRHEVTPESRKLMRAGLRAFLLGDDGPDEHVRNFLKEHRTHGAEARALGLTGSAGGFTIPQSFMPELDIALKDYSGVAQIARILDTTDGADLPWPTVNDSANAGHILTEGSAAATNVDPTFAAITLKAYVYTSDIVLIANQLIQDSAFNIDQEIGRLCGIRLGRILNTHCTTGTGSSQPKGIITAATLGKTAASATAVTYGEIVDLMHSVDPAYRAQRTAGWMMHDNILAILKKLLDSNGRPIFMPAGDAPGDIDRILNKPVYINQGMASAMTTGQKTVLFGMLDKYIIRRALNVTVTVLRERYAEYFQTGVVTFMRFDGNLIDAGTNPVKYLAQA
jgi:HK97 family phage major capsid protein